MKTKKIPAQDKAGMCILTQCLLKLKLTSIYILRLSADSILIQFNPSILSGILFFLDLHFNLCFDFCCQFRVIVQQLFNCITALA